MGWHWTVRYSLHSQATNRKRESWVNDIADIFDSLTMHALWYRQELTPILSHYRKNKQTNRSYSSYSTQTYLSALNMVKQLVRRKINKSRCVLIFADKNLQRNVNCLLLSGFFCLSGPVRVWDLLWYHQVKTCLVISEINAKHPATLHVYTKVQPDC